MIFTKKGNSHKGSLFYVITILWKDWDGKELAKTSAEEGTLPIYPNAKPSRSGYIFTGWDKNIVLATADVTYTAVYAQQTIINGGGRRRWHRRRDIEEDSRNVLLQLVH